MKLLIYLAAIAFFDLIAIMSAKFWNLKGNPWYMVISFFGFAMIGIFFSLSLKYETTAVLNVLWVAVSIILVTVFSYMLFKEPISLIQLIGFFVIIFGIILIEMK